MQWLAQNWASLLLLVLVLLFLLRRGGMACGVPGLGSHRHGPASDSAPVDPVSGEPVPPDKALTSAYQGRVYYFASRENRDRFEASPASFTAPGGQPEPAGHRHGGRGGGCC